MYKIYVAYHTNFDFISKAGYTPIHVGSKMSSIFLPILRDDSKENNISELNQFKKFKWPSMVRIGEEAERVINNSNFCTI